ncbi:bifunctional helix-turn-helix transcriptional regulator/GNAT family N-acetyltransferase [Halodesulfovibrio marinisediminis]|uniref:Transcriptional regulator, MarR family with acetyltransferase activity n=1 Tax=Halodesulfovibrio marinisediminis DSM 17456 TaxID=1121457 RepID=A0A1N6EAP0_9BACT|nr:helix-turn-helix domain-containing GNAT family N-acetyltransferase [Halodesulfovibrio marinisediminis]SIN80084.1 transcriptional regulator, MarR family with acetyltransferase activity [Halodesulfovibrio marinisediminis DSM 17456]
MNVTQVRGIRKYSRSLAREWRLVANRADQQGLTVPEAHALLELSSNKILSVQAIADMLLIDKSNASRTLASLGKLGLVVFSPNKEDRRAKDVSITDEGRKRVEQVHAEADELVAGALELLSPQEQEIVMKGLKTYAKALQYRRLQKDFSIRPIMPEDNSAVADVIRNVSNEFGLKAEEGYAVGDPVVDSMSEAYTAAGSSYWVVEREGQIFGGGGVGPLQGACGNLCELQKMYFMPECRGRGLGRRLVLMAMKFAREYGYDACYLETTHKLREATSLYEALGFTRQNCTLGDTGHGICELRYLYRFDGSGEDEG